MANFCCECIFWEKIGHVSGDMFGCCHSVETAMKVALDGKTHLSEEGTLWTAAYFGCVHWRSGHYVLIDLNKEME